MTGANLPWSTQSAWGRKQETEKLTYLLARSAWQSLPKGFATLSLGWKQGDQERRRQIHEAVAELSSSRNTLNCPSYMGIHIYVDAHAHVNAGTQWQGCMHGAPSRSSLMLSKIMKRQQRPPFLRVDRPFRASAKESPPRPERPREEDASPGWDYRGSFSCCQFP